MGAGRYTGNRWVYISREIMLYQIDTCIPSPEYRQLQSRMERVCDGQGVSFVRRVELPLCAMSRAPLFCR